MTTYIAHHGILGQKWGIRRFQNPDGTLTPLGRARLKRDFRKAKADSDRELKRRQPTSIVGHYKKIQAVQDASTNDSVNKAYKNVEKCITEERKITRKYEDRFLADFSRYYCDEVFRERVAKRGLNDQQISEWIRIILDPKVDRSTDDFNSVFWDYLKDYPTINEAYNNELFYSRLKYNRAMYDYSESILQTLGLTKYSDISAKHGGYEEMLIQNAVTSLIKDRRRANA